MQLDIEIVEDSLKELFKNNPKLAYTIIGFLSFCVKDKKDIDKIIEKVVLG